MPMRNLPREQLRIQLKQGFKNASTSRSCAPSKTSPDSLLSRILHFLNIISLRATTIMLFSKMSWRHSTLFFSKSSTDFRDWCKSNATKSIAVVRLCRCDHVFKTRCLIAFTASLLRIASHHSQKTIASTLAKTLIHLLFVSNSSSSTASFWKTMM